MPRESLSHHMEFGMSYYGSILWTVFKMEFYHLVRICLRCLAFEKLGTFLISILFLPLCSIMRQKEGKCTKISPLSFAFGLPASLTSFVHGINSTEWIGTVLVIKLKSFEASFEVLLLSLLLIYFYIGVYVCRWLD